MRLALAGSSYRGTTLLRAALGLAFSLRAGGSAWVDYGDQLCADGGAEAGAGVPAGAGFEAYGRAGVVGSGGRVVEGSLAFGGVDGGLDEASGLAVLGVGDGDEAGPEGGDGAGAADDHILAVDADDVAGGGVGVAGDVGNAAAAGGFGGLGNAGAGLPGGEREDVTDAASGCAFVVGKLVPDDLGGDGGAAAEKFGSTAGEDVGAGGGEIDVVLASGDAVGGAVVAGCGVGVGGGVLAAIDGDCGDLGSFLSNGFEVGAEVGGLIATAEFDDADGLAGGRGVGRELIERCDLGRGEGGAGG